MFENLKFDLILYFSKHQARTPKSNTDNYVFGRICLTYFSINHTSN